jgi:hypothetical protein
VAVDRFALLEWLVRREDDEPGSEIGGPEIMTRAAHLNQGDQYAWMAVARAAAELKRLRCIDWRCDIWPDRRQEPPLHLFNDQDMQRVRGIIVTDVGHSTLAARRKPVPAQQINVVARIRSVALVADVLLPAEGELEALGLSGDFAPLVCTTLGPRGARVQWDGASELVAAPEANEVDPTGAGDTFAAAFAVATLNGAEPVEAARAAAILAASAVEHLGGMEAPVGRARQG